MEDSVGTRKHFQQRGKINKLITPEMRQQIRELKDQLDEYLRDVRGYCDLLNNIREATFMAQQSARCLLTNDPFEAWEKIRDQDEFDAFHGLAEKQNTKGEPKVERFITPKMRQQIIGAKETLEEYANCLGEFINDVKKLKIFGDAIELAESLHCSEPLETSETRKKREEEDATMFDIE